VGEEWWVAAHKNKIKQNKKINSWRKRCEVRAHPLSGGAFRHGGARLLLYLLDSEFLFN
jgi:hypothetical protein